MKFYDISFHMSSFTVVVIHLNNFIFSVIGHQAHSEYHTNCSYNDTEQMEILKSRTIFI